MKMKEILMYIAVNLRSVIQLFKSRMMKPLQLSLLPVEPVHRVQFL